MSVSSKTHTIVNALINQIKTQFPSLNITMQEKRQGAFYGTFGKIYINIAFDMFDHTELEIWEDQDKIHLLGENLKKSLLHTREDFNLSYTSILNLIHSKISKKK